LNISVVNEMLTNYYSSFYYHYKVLVSNQHGWTIFLSQPQAKHEN